MISHGKDIKVFSGNSNPALAKEICQLMGTKLGEAEVKGFADGEASVSIYETVRAGRKTERTACTKGGGGSDTSPQSTNEIYGDTKGGTEGLDKGWTEPGDFTGLKGSQRSSVLSSAKGAFHCGGLRSISGIFREISRRLPQSDEAKGSPQQSD